MLVVKRELYYSTLGKPPYLYLHETLMGEVGLISTLLLYILFDGIEHVNTNWTGIM